jgi:glucokinase
MIIGGDLGGTKTLLALAEADAGAIRIVRQKRYASADYPGFDALLGDFLADAPAIAAACFGVAGPTDGREAKLTYLPWQLSSAALSRHFAIPHVTLANDFAAAAHGLPLLEAKQVLTLHAGRPLDGAPRVLLGAGTGLDVAGLIRQAGDYQVVSGEGGHFGFSPQTPEQLELARWLLAQSGRVTTEDIVSGPGLARIYAFFGGRPQPAEQIGQAALSGSDLLARRSLDLWLGCYGAFAGDLAMHWLARGGVYLAGGMAAKLMPKSDCTPFIDAFLAKREHRDLVSNMPIHLITAEDLGLRGALALAAAARP